jgi:hypothetical protein
MVTSKGLQHLSTVDWDRPLFSLEGFTYSRRDVLAAAIARGDWRDLENRVRAGLACLKCASATPPPSIDLQQAAEDFRYTRNLITVEETEEWLDRSGVTFEEWTAYLERSLLRQAWADHIDDISLRFPVSEREVSASVEAEAICSGDLARFAEVLAGRVAVCERARQNPRDLSDITALEATFQMHARAAATPDALQAQVEAHCLDWIRVSWRCITFTHEETAKEAALCLIHDREPLEDVASRGRTTVRAEERLLESIDRPFRDLVLSAKPGDVVGPIAAGIHEFELAVVGSRQVPTLQDADIRHRAERAVVAALVAEGLKRVRWHEIL